MKRIQSTRLLEKYLIQLNLEDAFPEPVRNLIALHSYEKGEYLCQAGNEISYFQIIVSGKCKVTSMSETGKEVTLNFLGPLSLHGDIELFMHCPTINQVVALNHVTVIAVPRAVFFDTMMNVVGFLKVICGSLASKIYNSTQHHSNNMLYPVRVRFCRYLLEEKYKQDNNCLSFTMEDAAQLLGTTARHLRRILHELEEENIVERKGRKLTLLDPSSLSEIASTL